MKNHRRLSVCLALLIAAMHAWPQTPALADQPAPSVGSKHPDSFPPACGSEGTGDVRATTFLMLYVNICLGHIAKLDELRAKLAALPRLPPEIAAKLSTSSIELDVWPVPDPHGHFLVAVGRHKSICAVYARRVDTEQVKAHFEQLVSKAPQPVISTERSRSKGLGATGKGETVFYKWSLPNVPRAHYFGLSTNPDPDADIQAHFSVTLGTE